MKPNRVLRLAIFLNALLLTSMSFAFSVSTPSLGLGYYSQNAFFKTTDSETSKGSLTGASYLPLLAQFEWSFIDDWYLVPRLGYTVLGRKSAGDSAETKFLQLVLPVGMNFYTNGSILLDWAVGPGLTRYTTKGKGGVVSLSNGTSTANFARPGGSSSAQTLFLNLAAGLTYSKIRYGFEIDVEGLLSSEKRTASFMLNGLYRFGDN